MTGRLARLVTLAAVLAVPLGLPVSSPAKPKPRVSDQSESSEFELAASNGYTLTFGRTVISLGSRWLAVASATASKEADSASKEGTSVKYDVVTRPAGADQLRFRLPEGGLISVHFHEQSRTRRRPAANCSGRGELVRRGVATGVIRLHGESGFTSVDATEARGSISFSPREKCTGTASRALRYRKPQGGHTNALYVSGQIPQGKVRVFAYQSDSKRNPSSNLSFLSGSLIRHRGGTTITETQALASDDRSWLKTQSNGQDLRAELQPDAPFTGAAKFERRAGGYDWAGTLSAEMPISGPIPLTGPHFKEGLCVDSRCVGKEGWIASLLAEALAP